MQENKEITALLHLIDDPDEEVYNTVSERILSYGKDIIPNLEQVWKNFSNEITQKRVEMLIHGVHFKDILADFTKWKENKGQLLDGAFLVAKYHYPDLETESIKRQIEKLRRNIWIELNNYLTPIETINVVNSIIFSFNEQKGVELNYEHHDPFLLNKSLENKKGNPFGNGILYLILCQLLDVPVKAINIPRQFLLGYYDDQYDLLNPAGLASEKIKFFIDPLNGQLYSHKDVKNYFNRLSLQPAQVHYKPMDDYKIISFLLKELSKCHQNKKEAYKTDELLSLINILDQ